MEILRLMGILLLIILVIVIGSKAVYKDDYAVMTVNVPMPAAGSDTLYGLSYLDYPSGFNKDNCVIISLMSKFVRDDRESEYATVGSTGYSSEYLDANYGLQAMMLDNNISVKVYKVAKEANAYTANVRVVLMKLPEVDITGYQMGDVNMDGRITQADADLVLDYYVGNASLTDKQFKLADMNHDGKITPADATLIQQLIQS